MYGDLRSDYRAPRTWRSRPAARRWKAGLTGGLTEPEDSVSYASLAPCIVRSIPPSLWYSEISSDSLYIANSGLALADNFVEFRQLSILGGFRWLQEVVEIGSVSFRPRAPRPLTTAATRGTEDRCMSTLTPDSMSVSSSPRSGKLGGRGPLIDSGGGPTQSGRGGPLAEPAGAPARQGRGGPLIEPNGRTIR